MFETPPLFEAVPDTFVGSPRSICPLENLVEFRNTANSMARVSTYDQLNGSAHGEDVGS